MKSKQYKHEENRHTFAAIMARALYGIRLEGPEQDKEFITAMKNAEKDERPTREKFAEWLEARYGVRSDRDGGER